MPRGLAVSPFTRRRLARQEDRCYSKTYLKFLEQHAHRPGASTALGVASAPHVLPLGGYEPDEETPDAGTGPHRAIRLALCNRLDTGLVVAPSEPHRFCNQAI